jgi:hypothetical protein
VKFTIPIPEPSYPALPFLGNIKPYVVLDPSVGILYVHFGDTETPLHPGAQERQASAAWNAWDSKRWII